MKNGSRFFDNPYACTHAEEAAGWFRRSKRKRRALMRKRRKRARRIRALCKLIVCAAMLFILFSLGYAVYYMTRKTRLADPELSGKLQEVLDGIMPRITADCTDTYEQIKACYDYLIDNCSYSQTVKYSYEEDAYLLLTEFKGSCTYYVAALHYMLRYIGVDNSIINGYRYVHPESETAASFHRWIEIKLEGVPYVLDPQWEDSLSHGGDILYERFFLTHEELDIYYDF